MHGANMKIACIALLILKLGIDGGDKWSSSPPERLNSVTH